MSYTALLMTQFNNNIPSTSSSSSSSSLPRKKRQKRTPWTREEDSLLTAAVKQFGGKNWKAIAAQVPDRTSGQCNSRWNVGGVAASPSSSLLIPLQMSQLNNNNIFPSIPSTSSQLSSSSSSSLPRKKYEKKRKTWTREEDSLLTAAFKQFGGKNWKAIAAQVPNRTSGQCNSRWNVGGLKSSSSSSLLMKAMLEPAKKSTKRKRKGKGRGSQKKVQQKIIKIKSDDPRAAVAAKESRSKSRKWTPEEDDYIRDMVKNQGVCRWKEMSKSIARTGAQCSQRWKKVLDPNVKRFVRWTSDEDAELIKIHSMHPDWSNKQVAELMPDRTPTQCHNRWWDKANPLLRWEKWSQTEDNAVWEGRKTGASWSKIVAEAPCLLNRAHVAVKNRWHSLKRRIK